ncbi:MAG: hypothetical protein KF820_04750 [Candidatus Paracaedibacteraceae bacterium]|nr:hypothetical protein [Candidatus Paracaedibacteraceae bacterium]
MVNIIQKLIFSLFIIFSLTKNVHGDDLYDTEEEFSRAQETTLHKTLAIAGGVAAATAIPLLAYSLLPSSTTELRNAQGDVIYYPHEIITLESGQSFVYFSYLDPVTQCVLGCIDSLGGVCKTLFFRGTGSTAIAEDCMIPVTSNQTILTDVFWSVGNSVMSFFMTKRPQ